VTVVDTYLIIKVPATGAKPDQDEITVSGEIYEIVDVDRDTLNWILRLRKSRDIR
jgi:hypothetical protein